MTIGFNASSDIQSRFPIKIEPNSIEPGLGLLSRCLYDNTCIGFPHRKGLSCQLSVGEHTNKLENYCCISEGSPCHIGAREDECCNVEGPRAMCSSRRHVCTVESFEPNSK